MRAYSYVLDHIPASAKSLVDIGCGKGELGYLARADTRFHFERVVGIEAFSQFADFVKKHNVYDDFLNVVLGQKLPFRDGEFDVSVLSQVIDHLTGKDGVAILEELERITKMRVLIVADNVEHDAQTEFINPYQEHQSDWTVNDFKIRGYQVYGIGAFKHPLPSHALERIMQMMVRRLPTLSRHILAVKDVGMR